MTITSKSCLSLALSVLFCGLIVFNPAVGVQQKVIWTLDDGNALIFYNNVPDISPYRDIIPRVDKVCVVGWWHEMQDVNYRKNWGPHGTLQGSELWCSEFPPSKNVSSFRHWGAGETTVDAISLYSNHSWLGDEILVEGKIHAGISTPILSVAATGTSSWQLFEGQQLDGKSYCFEVPQTKYNFNWLNDVRTTAKLSTIGSVFKGCDWDEIQQYKINHFQ